MGMFDFLSKEGGDSSSSDSTPRILTPGSETPQGGQIVTDAKGNTETISKDGTITLDKPLPTTEPEQPSSQNPVNLNDYDESLNVPLNSVPSTLEAGKSPATVFVATKKENENSTITTPEAPKEEPSATQTTIAETNPTQPTVVETPAETETQRREDGKAPKQYRYERDASKKVNSLTEYMSDDEKARYDEFQSEPKTEDTGPLTQEEIDRISRGGTVAMSKKGQQALGDIDAISKDLKGQNFSSSLAEIMPDDEALSFKKSQEIKANEKLNEGFDPQKQLSQSGQNFFARQDQIAENAKEQANKDEEMKELRGQIDELRSEIERLREIIRGLSSTEPEPVEPGPGPLPVVPPPPPGPEPTPEPTPEPSPEEIERRERATRRALLVGGVVSGVAAGAFVASSAVPPIMGTLIVTTGVLRIADPILLNRANKLSTRIQNEIDPATREKLEKRLATINKIRNVTVKYLTPFIGGAAIGFGGTMLFRNLFMGGQSVLERFANPPAEVINTPPPTSPDTPPQPEAPPTSPQTPPQEPGPLPTSPEIPVTPTEGWLNGDSFRASELGWDYNRLGWLGDNVSLSASGGSEGLLQKDFFGQLSQLVPKEQMMGQTNGDIVNSFLRQVYNGMNPTDAAQKASEILLNQ